LNWVRLLLYWSFFHFIDGNIQVAFQGSFSLKDDESKAFIKFVLKTVNRFGNSQELNFLLEVAVAESAIHFPSSLLVVWRRNIFFPLIFILA
jgi:hypothetical protein